MTVNSLQHSRTRDPAEKAFAASVLVQVIATSLFNFQAASAQSFSLDDNPASPVHSSAPSGGTGFGAEDPFGLGTLGGSFRGSPTLGDPPVSNAASGDGAILLRDFSTAPGVLVNHDAVNGAFMSAHSTNHADFYRMFDQGSERRIEFRLNLVFSVDRAAVGLPTTDVADQVLKGQAPGDIFTTTNIFEPPRKFRGTLGQGVYPGESGTFSGFLEAELDLVAKSNRLLFDESFLGLVAGGQSAGVNDVVSPPSVGAATTHDNVDSFNFEHPEVDNDGALDGNVYFAIYQDEATAQGGGVLPGNIYAAGQGQTAGSFTPYATAAQMGLDAGGAGSDAIDALVMYDNDAFPFFNAQGDLLTSIEPVQDYALFSLAPGSAALAAHGLSAGDVLYTDFSGFFAVFTDAEEIGLDRTMTGGAPGPDNVDALEAVIGQPDAMGGQGLTVAFNGNGGDRGVPVDDPVFSNAGGHEGGFFNSGKTELTTVFSEFGEVSDLKTVELDARYGEPVELPPFNAVNSHFKFVPRNLSSKPLLGPLNKITDSELEFELELGLAGDTVIDVTTSNGSDSSVTFLQPIQGNGFNVTIQDSGTGSGNSWVDVNEISTAADLTIDTVTIILGDANLGGKLTINDSETTIRGSVNVADYALYQIVAPPGEPGLSVSTSGKLVIEDPLANLNLDAVGRSTTGGLVGASAFDQNQTAVSNGEAMIDVNTVNWGPLAMVTSDADPNSSADATGTFVINVADVLSVGNLVNQAASFGGDVISRLNATITAGQFLAERVRFTEARLNQAGGTASAESNLAIITAILHATSDVELALGQGSGVGEVYTHGDHDIHADQLIIDGSLFFSANIGAFGTQFLGENYFTFTGDANISGNTFAGITNVTEAASGLETDLWIWDSQWTTDGFFAGGASIDSPTGPVASESDIRITNSTLNATDVGIGDVVATSVIANGRIAVTFKFVDSQLDATSSLTLGTCQGNGCTGGFGSAHGVQTHGIGPGEGSGGSFLHSATLTAENTFIDVGGNLTLGPAAELELTIEGLQRASATTNGEYAAVDAANAALDGVLRIIFDFPGVQLGDAFDLISLDAGGVFTGSFDEVRVSGLPTGLTAEASILGNSVMATVVAGLSADFDNDDDVDDNDFAIWESAFGLNSGADADGDGDGDGGDFLILQRQHGLNLASLANSENVPEPDAGLLMLTALFGGTAALGGSALPRRT